MPKGHATGVTQSRHYARWRGMMRRCYERSNRHYEGYGARGITVCASWHASIVFIQWCEFTYQEGMTLDRIDVEGSYSPDNCTWATKHQQEHNKRNNNKDIGVYWDKSRDKWRAQLTVDKILMLSKCFDTKELAKLAYDAAYIEHVMGGVPF